MSNLKTNVSYKLDDLKLGERLNLIKKKKLFLGITLASILIGASIIITFVYFEFSSEKNVDRFPDFITKNEDYFRTRIGLIPEINSNTYRLVVWGQVNNPKILLFLNFGL